MSENTFRFNKIHFLVIALVVIATIGFGLYAKGSINKQNKYKVDLKKVLIKLDAPDQAFITLVSAKTSIFSQGPACNDLVSRFDAIHTELQTVAAPSRDKQAQALFDAGIGLMTDATKNTCKGIADHSQAEIDDSVTTYKAGQADIKTAILLIKK